MKTLGYLLIAVCTLSSCVNTKRTGMVWLNASNDAIYEYTTSPPPASDVTKKDVTQGLQVTIKEPTANEPYTINLMGSTLSNQAAFGTYTDTHGSLTSLSNDIFFPYDIRRNGGVIANTTYAGGTSTVAEGEILKYQEQQFVFQAVSVPFKVRGKEGSVPYQVSTGVNAGFALGWKVNQVSVKRLYQRSTDQILKYRKNQLAITPAIFTGPTVVELTAENTENALTSSRKVMGWNTGVMLVGGINKFNLGFAVGFDTPFGKAGDDWIYKNKPWFGTVIGIEFIK